MRGGFGGRGGGFGGRGGFGGGYGGRGGYGAGGAGGYGGHQGGGSYAGAPQETAAAPNPFTDFATSGGERGPLIFVRNVSLDDCTSDMELTICSYLGLPATKTSSNCSPRSEKSSERRSNTSPTEGRVVPALSSSILPTMPRPRSPSSLVTFTAADLLVFPTSSTQTRMVEMPWRLMEA